MTLPNDVLSVSGLEVALRSDLLRLGHALSWEGRADKLLGMWMSCV